MALLIFWGAVCFASTTLRMAAPLYGLALLLGVLWALKLLVAEAVSWKKSLMHLPVGAFAIYALIRYCTSPLEYESRVELFEIGVCTLLYFIAAANFYHRRDRAVLILTLLILGLGESFFAVWQFLTKATTLFGFARPEAYISRGSGTFICPNHLAGFLVMVLGLTIARLALDTTWRDKVQKMIVQKVFLAFGIFILMIGLVVTLSRGGWMAAVLGLLVLLFWGGRDWGRLWPRFVVAAAGVCLLVLLAFKTEAVSHRFIKTYLMTQVEGEARTHLQIWTFRTRLEIWNATVTMIRDHPLCGTGGGTWEWFYPRYRPEKLPGNPEYPHNDLLNVLSDYGLVGFALLAMGLTCFYGHAYGLARAENSPEERSFAIGSAMAVTSVLAHSLVDFNLHVFSNAALFMTLMGFTVAMKEHPQAEDRAPMARGARYALAIGLLLICGVGGWFIGRAALAYQYKTSGDDLKSRIHYEEARADYRHAILLDPKNPEPYARMGDICLNQSQWRANPAVRQERLALAREALDWYDKALKLNPYFVEVLTRVARAYEILGDKTQVLNYCERAIALDPQSPVTYLYLATFYLHQNELPQAEKAALRAGVLNWGYSDPTAGHLLEQIRAEKNRPH